MGGTGEDGERCGEDRRGEEVEKIKEEGGRKDKKKVVMEKKRDE